MSRITPLEGPFDPEVDDVLASMLPQVDHRCALRKCGVTPSPPEQPAADELRLVDVLQALSDPVRLEVSAT